MYTCTQNPYLLKTNPISSSSPQPPPPQKKNHGKENKEKTWKLYKMFVKHFKYCKNLTCYANIKIIMFTDFYFSQSTCSLYYRDRHSDLFTYFVLPIFTIRWKRCPASWVQNNTKNRDNLDSLLGTYCRKYMLNIRKLYLREISMFFAEIINMQRVKCTCRN